MESLRFLGRLAKTNTFSSFSLPFSVTRGCLWGGDQFWISSWGVFSASRHASWGRFDRLLLCESSREFSRFSLKQGSSWRGLEKQNTLVKKQPTHLSIFMKLANQQESKNIQLCNIIHVHTQWKTCATNTLKHVAPAIERQAIPYILTLMQSLTTKNMITTCSLSGWTIHRQETGYLHLWEIIKCG